MKDFMKSQMERMMSGMMKPEDMPLMMDNMMTKIFSGMSSEDKMQFVSNMMPRCMEMIFDETDKDAKDKLAKEMLEKMIAILKNIVTNDVDKS